MRAVNSSNAGMSQRTEISVRNGPAMIVFARTAGPYASAMPAVTTCSPALAAAYGDRALGRAQCGDARYVDHEPPMDSFMCRATRLTGETAL